jgi:hypothetical protein
VEGGAWVGASIARWSRIIAIDPNNRFILLIRIDSMEIMIVQAAGSASGLRAVDEAGDGGSRAA